MFKYIALYVFRLWRETARAYSEFGANLLLCIQDLARNSPSVFRIWGEAALMFYIFCEAPPLQFLYSAFRCTSCSFGSSCCAFSQCRMMDAKVKQLVEAHWGLGRRDPEGTAGAGSLGEPLG